MKCQRGAHWSYGYTIVEVMIFLAVSGGLLGAAINMINGQEERTRFSTSVREVESKLGDIFNDVETGYYPNSGSFGCRVDPVTGKPEIAGIAKKQGENQDCLFLGKAIQFYNDPSSGTASNYRAFTIVGRRLTPPPELKDVSSIDQAEPQAFDAIADSGSFPGGVEVTKIKYVASGSDLGGIVVLAPLGTFSIEEPSTAASNGKPRLSSINVSVNFNDNSAGFRGAVSNLDQDDINEASQGAVVCLRHSAGGRVAAVAIGVQPNPNGSNVPVPFGQRLATQAYFDDEAKQLGCTS